MKYFVGFFILFIFLLPYNVFAGCNSDSSTVVYINGILTTYPDALKDLDNLRIGYVKKTGDYFTNFIVGYNESHIAGLGDAVETASQILNSSISDYDRNTILIQIHSQITTRKILLLGHSQGTFYTNEIYDYLTKHGEPESALGVYNVATPASFVAGDGAYVTSKNDKVINFVRVKASAASKIGAKQPLPANIDISLTSAEAADRNGGHSFSGVYLTGATAKIVSDVDSALKKLLATEIPDSAKAGCFTPPEKSISYRAQEAIFFVADPTARGAVVAAQTTYNSALAVTQSAVKIAETVYTNLNQLSTNISSKGLALISGYLDNSEQPSNDVVTTDSNPVQQNVADTALDNAIPADNTPQNIETPLPENQPQVIVAENTLVQPPLLINPEPQPINETPITPTSPPSVSIPIGGSGPVSVPQQNNSVNSPADEIQTNTSSTDNNSSTTTENSSSSTNTTSTNNTSSTPPDNSQSTSTPRTPPTINSFQAVYTSSTTQFDFSWLPSADSEGSTTTNKYSIYDITTSTPGVLIFETSSTATSSYSFAYTATDTRRNYQFNFVVEDSLNLSNSTTTTIFAETPAPPPAPLPSQLIRDEIIGTTGGAQKILFGASTTISAAVFYTEPNGGNYCCSQAYVEIHAVTAEDTLGVFVAMSSPKTIGQYDAPGEITFTFDSPVSLEAAPYWFIVSDGPSPTNRMGIYGSVHDPYPDGYWKPEVSSDAYFRLISQ